ncbi:MAG TPA: hypothetical protein VM915_07360 [Verrucomicrobiae bacterium]|jgi:hypothetical protein|nr:hypothetical protein [Verrucomicrobiae bacterium]
MNFHCLVSKSRGRRPLTYTLHGTDECAAAFTLWTGAGRPYVRRAGPDRVVVTDGHTEIKVQILSRATVTA